MRIMVLGGGTQGSAAAFDLVQRPGVEEVILADRDVGRVRPFLEPYLGGPLRTLAVDAQDEDAAEAAMSKVDAVACALPYYFNLPMTKAAIRAGTHFCDLGGNTSIVEWQCALDSLAVEAGVSVIPDCGLAPGMVNILAAAGIEALDEADRVEMRVGGLPRHPKPPLNYQIVYSIEGVLDYYTNDSLILENGKPVRVESLTGVETVSFPAPAGELEAFHTAGGISTLPYRYRGRVREMNYKTLRYPGHAAIMKAIRDLGLLLTDTVEVEGVEVVPRDLFIALVTPLLRNPDGDDLVVMRVEVHGKRDGIERTIRWQLIDEYDEENGITAMMRTTGYSLAVTALMQAGGKISARGVKTPDQAVPAAAYVEELAERGIRIRRTEE